MMICVTYSIYMCHAKFSFVVTQVTRLIKQKLAEVSVSDHVIIGFTRFFVPPIVAKYNRRAQHLLQVEVSSRRRGLIAVPIDGEVPRESVAISPAGKAFPEDLGPDLDGMEEAFASDEDSFSVDCSVTVKSVEVTGGNRAGDRTAAEESKAREGSSEHQSTSECIQSMSIFTCYHWNV
jgi:hypothetical protein